MKFLVLCCLAALVFGAPQRHNPYGRRHQRQTSRIPEIGESVVIPYNYGYEIRDSNTMNYQNKAEMKDEEGNVYGSYSVLMPDGIIYTTSYNVTKESGYVARLTKTPATFRRRTI